MSGMDVSIGGDGDVLPRPPPAAAGVPGGIPRRADRGAIRRNNLAVVTRHLAVAGRASRAGIAAGTGLTNSTVARLVSELRDLVLVRAGGTAPARGAGRPGAWVELDGTGLLVVGCEVNVHRMVVRVCDLGGRLRAHVVRHVDASSMSAVTATRRLGGLCREMISQATSTLAQGTQGQGTSVVSVVAAVPGVVNDSTHTVIAAPNLRWRNFPFAVALSEALDLAGVPVTIGNDANFAALAEFWSGLHPGIDDLVYVTGDVGIGGGLIVGGRLLASANGQAGEVGHMTLDPSGPECACGRHGCWESYIGLDALRTSAGRRQRTLSPPAFTASVARLAAAQDPATLAALSSVGTWLGFGLSNLINLLGTQRVVLGGYFAELSVWILPAARASLSEHVFINQPIDSLVATSTLGPAAAATGAARYAIDRLMSDPTLLDSKEQRPDRPWRSPALSSY
jgi:predicted NBD/HSP70 family sugar kinase